MTNTTPKGGVSASATSQPGASATDEITSSTFSLTPDQRKTMKSLFWRHMWLLEGINWARMQGQVVPWVLQPSLRKIYKDDDQYWDAMKRHSAFFNTTPQMAPFIFGLALSMEEEHAKDPEHFDAESINGVKVSLMGPFAGIGDSFFTGTFRIIATALSLGLCQAGNILGPILFLVAFNIPSVIFRWFGGILGYKMGAKYISGAAESGLMGSITKACGIVGLLMVGVMAAQNVHLTILAAPVLGGQALAIQSLLDQILLGLLPLGVIFLTFHLFKKKVNPIWVIVGILVVSFVLSFFGIA